MGNHFIFQGLKRGDQFYFDVYNLKFAVAPDKEKCTSLISISENSGNKLCKLNDKYLFNRHAFQQTCIENYQF